MTWHSSKQNKQCSRKLNIRSVLLLRRLELLPDELGLSLSLSFILFKKSLYVIRRAVCSYAVFVIPECGSIICKSLSKVITTLIACLTKSRYPGRICEYRCSRSTNYTTLLHSLPAIKQKFQVIWDLHYDSHTDSLQRRWCYKMCLLTSLLTSTAV